MGCVRVLVAVYALSSRCSPERFRPEAIARGLYIRPEIVAGERDVVPPHRGDVRQLLVRERDTLAANVGDGAGQLARIIHRHG